MESVPTVGRWIGSSYLTDCSTQDAFEDAAESVRMNSKTPSRSNSIDNGEETLTVVGLGIQEDTSPAGGSSSTAASAHVADKGAEDGVPPKMSARLSRWVSDDPVLFAGEASPPLNAPAHSRQVTAEKVPSAAEQAQSALSRGGEEQAQNTAGQEHQDEDNERTPILPSHSRQNTTETAPALVTASAPTAAVQANVDQESSHSRQATPESVPSVVEQAPTPIDDPAVSLSTIRAGLRSHSRNATAEGIPILPPPQSEMDRERSVSPTKSASRGASPTMMVRGLSGDVPLQSPPPPSSLGRVQALEQRNIGDRGGQSPPSGGLMRTASTRMGQFLGRMGSMRKPGRSPPGPRQESRFSPERRNTAHSLASLTSNGGDSLATISDGPEGTDGYRPSLQDQFRNLRKQSEYSLQETNGNAIEDDPERTPIKRTISDAGDADVEDTGDGSPDARSHRASSTASLVRSPPMNPNLPPGTASGLSAGPAEEPKPVDWDLWQAVVYEGPSAVQRSSGEELNQAIASGIPAAIRGVVWQVLADSKSADLENMYRTLKSRGSLPNGDNADVENSRPQSLSRTTSQNNVHESTEQEDAGADVTSSRASVHSEESTPPTSNLASPPLSVRGDEQELKLRLYAEKQKREAAALAKLEKAIRRDLGSRTSFSKYTQAAGLQDGLFGVCKAYALFDEGVGYAQGVNFIAMPLLFNMAEEEAFTLLVRMMSKYDLRSMFTGDMAGLHLRLYQFERLLEDCDPALYCHLRRRSVSPQLYATQWFLTLFAYRFPLQLVLRIYDLVLSEGLTAILKFGLVLMQHNRDTLLGMRDMSQLTTFLKEKLFDVYIDKSPSASSLLDSGFFGSVTGGADKELYRADEMVRDACEVKISDATLAQYTSEWQESQRQTQERESELENLRTANATLTTRVRNLEERTQQQDNEHVNIAGDLVRVKVENDTLADENEGYKVRIEELQKLVDGQPAEIEAKLKDEMDRILQRNSEVQSENRVLKEEMEEMEHELVNVKMLHAQVSVGVSSKAMMALTDLERRRNLITTVLFKSGRIYRLC